MATAVYKVYVALEQKTEKKKQAVFIDYPYVDHDNHYFERARTKQLD
jgi:hypothetical protein